MRRRLGLGLVLAAGVVSAAAAQGLRQFDGQYVGKLTLERHIKGDCTAPPLGSLYPLVVSDGQVRFQYTPRFNTTLLGSINSKGYFKASARAHKGFVRMTGHIRGYHVVATIISPSCRYTFRAD